MPLSEQLYHWSVLCLLHILRLLIPKGNLSGQLAEVFYKPDAVRVTQPIVSEHCGNSVSNTKGKGYHLLTGV